MTEPLQASVKNTFLHFDVFGDSHANARRARSHSVPARDAFVRSFDPSIFRAAATMQHDNNLLKDVERQGVDVEHDTASSQSTLDSLSDGSQTPSRRGSSAGENEGSERASCADYQEDMSLVSKSHSQSTMDDDVSPRSSSESVSDIAFGAEQEVNGAVEDKTTVMLRNLPGHVTRDGLIEVLEAEGFAAKFDFVYLPVHFAYGHHFGYAFVNLVDAEQARMFWNHFTGFKMVADDGTEMDTYVNWSVLQGLDGNIIHYRNSQLMHPEVSDRLRPVLLRNGMRVEFPPPTKPLRKPRLRSPKSAVQDAPRIYQ